MMISFAICRIDSLIALIANRLEAERRYVPCQGFGERRPARENPHARPASNVEASACGLRSAETLQGQAYLKRRSHIGTALRRDRAAHELGELAADRKPEPAAAEAARGRFIGLGEGLEDLLDRRSVHADAGIG